MSSGDDQARATGTPADRSRPSGTPGSVRLTRTGPSRGGCPPLRNGSGEIPRQGEKRCGRCGAVKSRECSTWTRRLATVSGRSARRARVSGRGSGARSGKRRPPNGNATAEIPAIGPRSKWKARNPEKLRAQHAVAAAVRSGRLVTQPCEECGAKAHAHHADYAEPLEVRWLCPLHHARQHRAEGRLARSAA